MPDLDLTARARLDAAADWLRRDEEDPEYIRLGGDIEALLAALDAAERKVADLLDDSALDGLPEGDQERYAQTSPGQMFRALLTAEQAIREHWRPLVAAARAWLEGHPHVDHACSVCRALRAAMAALPPDA